ncbi:hypothetical protein AYI70_g1019 [Smittium culicis]|uniref:Uncharacterized protein n=1 Tax=Smittium culicis TaxID=133412 RepID=A0A1R1YEM3_9FUNG|nr:hypothetical protein AYI70_g1019 [Smittium culicis]
MDSNNEEFTIPSTKVGEKDSKLILDLFGAIWNPDLKRYTAGAQSSFQNSQFWFYVKSIDSSVSERFSDNWDLSGIHTVYSNYGNAVMNSSRDHNGLSRKQRCIFGEILNEFGESFDVNLTLWEYDTDIANLFDVVCN